MRSGVTNLSNLCRISLRLRFHSRLKEWELEVGRLRFVVLVVLLHNRRLIHAAVPRRNLHAVSLPVVRKFSPQGKQRREK